jgi:predicted RNA-binding Zn-ribbon protein involved in translation (DUF1610 family)
MSVSIDPKRPAELDPWLPAELDTKYPEASAESVCPNCGQPMGIRLIVADRKEELTTYVCVQCGSEKTVSRSPR